MPGHLKRFSGVGLHTGCISSIQILPAEFTGQGIIFRQSSGLGEVRASHEFVVSTNRSTCLSFGEVRVDTVEHVLSALYGCGISDAIVLFEGFELPIGDGSSLPFVDLIMDAGVRHLDGDQDQLVLDRAFVVTDGRGAVLTAVPSDHFWIAATVDYSTYAAIGIQSAVYREGDYRVSVAYARTYGFYSELDALRAVGLGRGVSLDNVIALDANGAADPQTPLRSLDEIVRHKILDLIGDLSLTRKK